MKVKDNCNLKKRGGGINIKFDPRTLQNKGFSTETMRKGQEARVCTGRFRSVFGDPLCGVQDKQGELRQWASCWRPRRLLGTGNGLNYYNFLFVEPFDTRETNDGVNAVWHQESETILDMLTEGFCFYYKWKEKPRKENEKKSNRITEASHFYDWNLRFVILNTNEKIDLSRECEKLVWCVDSWTHLNKRKVLLRHTGPSSCWGSAFCFFTHLLCSDTDPGLPSSCYYSKCLQHCNCSTPLCWDCCQRVKSMRLSKRS